MEYLKMLINNFSFQYLTPLLFLTVVLLLLNLATYYYSLNKPFNQIKLLFKKYKSEGVVVIRSAEESNGIKTYILDSKTRSKKVCVNRFGKIKELDADGPHT